MVEPHQPPAKALDAKAEINEIMESFRQMKRERDIWQKMAIQLKQTVEEAFDQRDQLQSLLVATQAELENVKRTYDAPNPAAVNPSGTSLDKWLAQNWISTSFTRGHLGEPEKIFVEGNHQEALAFLDSLLGKVISLELPEARLLKAAVLRACRMSAKALEQCEEVLESCKRNPNMHWIRGKANFYKGICMFGIKNFDQACIAFTPIDLAEFFAPRAAVWKQRCDEEQRKVMLLEDSRDPAEHLAKHAALQGKPGEDNHTAQIYQDEQDFRRFLVPLGVPPPQKQVPDDKFTVEYALEESPSSTTAEGKHRTSKDLDISKVPHLATPINFEHVLGKSVNAPL